MAIKKLNMRDKTAVKFMWESGDYSAPEISKELNIELSTVRSVIARSGWAKGSREEEIRDRIEIEYNNAQDDIVRERAKQILDTKREVYAFARSLNQRAVQEFTGAIKDSTPLAVITPNIKALKLLAETAKLTKEMRWDALEIDKTDNALEELPELGIEEIEDDEIEKIREEQELAYQEASVVDDLAIINKVDS